MKRVILLALAGAFAVAAVAAADEPRRPEGPVVLTVGGAVTNPNRGPSDPEDATMLGFHDIGFEQAVEFDREMLEELEQAVHESALPGREDEVTFAGPRLAAVLEAAGAAGETVTLTGLDGYALDIERAYIVEHDPIVALSADGRPLGIGGLGPTVSVFPPTGDPDLAQEFADRKIWALFFIGVR